MAQGTAPSRRTTSHSGSARLSLSVGKATAAAPSPASGRHPLRQDWSISYVHRPPAAKVDYEKEIRRVATFGSIESFLHLYSHLTPPNELPAVTDVLVFVSRIGRPGVWEEMRDGGRFTIRLVHPITPLLYESLLLALIGDQFEESDNVVGCVLSVRQAEDILSVWVEEESDGVRNGALKEKILSLLSLPPTTTCDYRANRALLEVAAKPPFNQTNSGNPAALPETPNSHNHNNPHHNHNHEHHPRVHHVHQHDRPHRERERERGGDRDREHRHDQHPTTPHWGNGGGFRERRAGGGAGAGVGAAPGGVGTAPIWGGGERGF
ncbi:hypothetical protein CI109_106782 [Kwoniella shandongensis]|uniref:Uncharacterized protein n=1 Tax=Kwoniella shandongensis TaxID=1734106 RepID=A0A5M6CAI2_9TREE|nr:uncharacterized protein CI109_000962 [Kwoniella shandongensis]KAA5530782.1 hypothetical protein CI109_000962 [Kwoniella shandongensis]